MWNRVSGKSNNPNDNLPSNGSRRNEDDRRNDDEQRHSAHHSSSIASSNSNKKSSSRADDRDPRGFNPTSTSYSSTTRGQYPGAASASIASSYATASGNNNDEPYMAPGLVRNASLADQMPRSSLSRSSRDQGEARETRDKKRDKAERSDGRDQGVERRRKRDNRDKMDKGLRKSENRLDEEAGTSRGPEDFPDQVASSGFSQIPGQYDAETPGTNGVPPEHSALSSHVQDQFPGQFPTQSSAPYRPPLAASEGGPGLAAEYYGDDGQSVAEQPGNRVNTPSLIIGAEPHLQPALAVAAPPPEPSASGAVGAAASFFSGEFEEDEIASSHSQQNSSAYATGQTRPNSNYHPSPAPIIPPIGGAAMGSAAGYFVNSQTSSPQQLPGHESSIGGVPSEYSSSMTHCPPSQTQDSHYSSISRPPKPGKHSSQSSNMPTYAVGAAGAAGLAVAAYEHNHHSSNHDYSSTPQYSTTSIAQRRRNPSAFAALVNFFKDPEGVAQFEEYSQIIGVCRHCFAPGSSPRDAPRKHLYVRRRSNERYGSSTRIDKDSRYYSSDNEGRRKNNKSWLATGLAAYGLAKVGESLSNEKKDFDDTYSVKTGRFSPDRRDRRTRRRSRSKERVETRTTVNGKSDRKEAPDDISTGTKRTTYSTGRNSRTRSRSKDRKTRLTEAAIGVAPESFVVGSSSRPRSRSPKGTPVKAKYKSQEPSPERLHKTKKKKKRDRGFFGFGNGSSSSSSVDLAYAGSQDKHRSSKRPNGKSKDDKKAEAALLGLGAAAAALALNDGRQGHRKKGVRELVGVKETKDHYERGSGKAHRSKNSSGNLDDELWESAAEDDYESVNSDLAYGAAVRRGSGASLSSESSGTNKWGWRWGSKRNRRASSPRRSSSNHSSLPAVASAAGAGLASVALTSQDHRQGSAMDSTSSLPLQHVYPVPTSDPSRFDVGREGSLSSSSRPLMSSRPEAVPLQHPRPIAPVSAAIYSSQTAYDHSNSAPTGPAVFSQPPDYHHTGTSDARHETHEASIPGSFPRFEQQADDAARDFRIRRRDTSPARFGEDSISSPVAPRRRNSAKDDSAVRFDLTEEQEEKDRRERRRKRKEDKERREAEKQEHIEKDRRALKEQSSKKSGSKTKPDEVPKSSSEKSWAGPAAAGVIGAAIGAAAATDRSRSEETRDERRERRRRERELEDEEDVLSKSERRRRQREREDKEAATKESERLPDEISASREYANHQEHSLEKHDMSVWQEAASTKRSSSHENYGAFFTPLELLNESNDQVKITSANADADIDLEQVPKFVTVEPKRIHDLSDSPSFLPADNDDKIDPSKLSFPWQVPRLRLVEPTPPSTRGSTPIPQPKDAGDEGFEEPRKEPSPSKVRWGDDQTHEYTIIAPKEDEDDFIEPLSGEIGRTDEEDSSRSMHERDLPGYEMHPHNDSTMESTSAHYGEDAEFAATLAASAEDAGFDPSIVIDNPAYRRRDSPPGSNERSMPGGFDEEDEQRLNKKERKRKERASRRQSQNDGPNGRDEDAIVQDIISQVEESGSQPSYQMPLENHDDEWASTKKTKSRKSKKGRNISESRDGFFETSEIANKALESQSRDVYESPTEDVRSIAAISNEAESGRKSRKTSKRDSTGLDDAASIVSSRSTTEASKDPKPKPKERRKGSIWDRVLGKSTGSLPEDNRAKVASDEAILEDFEEPKKKSKKSKERRSARDDHDSKEQSSIEGTTPQVSGRISQDLPAKVYTPVPSGRALSKELLINSQDQGISLPPKFSDAGSVAQYLDHGIHPEQLEEKQQEPFLGTRPEPPPPPDTRAESEALSDPLETKSLPTSPPSSNLKSGGLGAILGGSAAVALNEAIQNNDPSRQDLSRGENEDFEHALDAIALDTVTHSSYNDSLDQEEDFVPQKTKKGKKNKRKAGQFQPEIVPPSLAQVVETKQSTNSMDSELLSPESVRQIQEQDAQDAVDSWFPSALPSNKAKKGKGKALVESLEKETRPSPSTYEPPRDNLENTVPAEGQGSDILTREMPREQVVDIMKAAAQDGKKDENEVSQSKKDKKGRKNLPQDDLPQDGLQTKKLPQDEFPKEDLRREDLPQDSPPRSDFQQETLPKYDLLHDELSQLEVQQKTNPQVNLLRDDFLHSQDSQDSGLQGDPRPDSLSALSSSAPAKVNFIDPFLEQGHGIVVESPKANPASQEGLDHGELTTAMSPSLELSPRATPLPDGDDDRDLLDERLGTPVPTSLVPFDDDAMESAAENPLEIPHVHDPSALIPGPQKQSQYLPSQAEQIDAGDYFATPSKKQSKKGKRAKQSFSAKDNETIETEGNDGPLPNVVTSTTLEDDWPKVLNEEPAMEVPQGNPGTVEDERGGFISKKKGKKGKKAKQSFSFENSKNAEIQDGQEPLPNMAASEAPEDREAMKLINESAVDVSQPKTEPLEDEWTGSNGKKKGKSGKIIKPSLLVGNNNTTEIEEENESLSTKVASKASEYDEAINSIAEPALHAPNAKMVEEEPIDLIDVPTNQAPKPEVVEDKGAGFDSKVKGKEVDEQRSNTLNLGPGLEETERQSQRQPDNMNERPSTLATMQTSHEVKTMLGLGETEPFIGDESKKAFPAESQAESNPQKPSEHQISGSDEPNLPVLYKPGTPQFEYAPEKAYDDAMSPTLDTSVASTNAAQAVQDILAAENNAESATDTKREAMVTSTGMEETAPNRPIKEDELDWNAPKEKKKKGKNAKKNELFSWDKPETLEPAEVSGPPSAMNTELEQEPAADMPTKEDEVDRDAPKKKKKGKKGKKDEVFSLDEPEIMEPAELSGPTAAMNPSQLKQDPAVKAMDEVFPRLSKKDKKGKKGKTKGVSRAVGEIRDEDEPNVVPTEDPQDEDKAEDLPAIIGNFQEEIEPSVILSEAPQDDNKVDDLHAVTRDSRNEVEHRVVPTEFPRNGDQEEVRSAVDRPSVTSDVREEIEHSLVPTEASQDEEKVRDLPADGMPTLRAEILKPVLPIELAENNGNEKSQETPLEQEQDVIPPKRRKDKKKDKKKSKKYNAFSLDDDENPTLGDGQTAGTKDLEKYGSEHIMEGSEKTVQETGLEQEEDVMLPTNKKGKKKSKKFNAFSLDSGVSPALEDEPVSQTKDLEKEAPKQTLTSSVDVVQEPGKVAEGLPQEGWDREETEEARPFEWKNDEAIVQSEQETARELKKDSEIDSNTYPLNASRDLQSKEAMHGYFDSVSAHAAASKIPHKATAAVASSLEQPASVSGEITAYHANELKDSIAPAVETDMDPLYSLKPSKTDEKRAEKARSMTGDEVSQEPRAVLKASSATEDPGEPPIIPVSQDSESRPNPETSAEEIEPTKIVQPGMSSGEDQGFQGSKLEEQPSQPGDNLHTTVEAEQEESFPNVKREKLSIPEPEEDRFPADEKELASVIATSPVQGREQASEQQPRDDLTTVGEIRSNQEEFVAGLEREQAPVLTEPGAIEEAKQEELPLDVPAQRAEKLKKQHVEAQWDQSRFCDLSSPAASEHPRETVDSIRNTEPVTNVEPLGSLDKDEPIPAVEVEMLDAQEQRDYNEEYAKELERQLSPLQERKRADPPRDEADTPVYSQSSINPVMNMPYEEEHRPLARPPALEDIIEESRSRSGSVQGSPVDRKDDFSPFKSTKKSKKGKKGKKQQPIIWEDETATPPPEPKSDQEAKPSTRSSEGPDSWNTDAARPLDLEESMDQGSPNDRIVASATRDFNNAGNESLIKNDWSGDYFAIQPSRPAEEDVGREDTHEFRRALSTEPPYSSRDQSPARERQRDQDDDRRDDAVKYVDQDGELSSLATDFHDKSRTEAEPAEEQIEDDFDPAAVGENEKGKTAKKTTSARRPSPQSLGQENLMDQPLDLGTPTMDTANERSPSRQHSLQPSHEDDELVSVAEGRHTSRGGSGSMEGIAAAVGLGVGALAAGSLSRRDSKEEGGRSKKAEEAGRRTDFEAETSEPESPLDRGEMSVEEQEYRQTPESEKAIKAWQHHQATPPRSPPSANYEAIADHPVVEDLGQSSETPKYRDSAIYVSGSPTIAEAVPYHRAVRDSGYPDTEASPTIDYELEDLDDPTELERGVPTGETVGRVQHRHSRAHETDERRRSTSSNPFEVSVEANSDYDVSISRPKERRKRSRRRSGTAYDSDDSADSGFDIQRRRRRQAMAGEPREPSPVSSTTKDRSSVLFDSRPSAKEETLANSHDRDISPRDNPVREEPSWSFDREASPQQRSRETSREGRSSNIPERALEAPGSGIPIGNDEDTGTSLFGGPRSHEDDLLSPSRSPRSSESRGRRRLNTISEDSADGSPLHKKDKRAVSDVGSPEAGVKGRRMRSPSVEGDVAGEYVSTHDSISGQPWPAAGEEKDSVVDERSRSRNSDQLSTFSSRHGALPGSTPRRREDEFRTGSAASMKSENNSIHAIIRTPDQVRSASGLSYRSSGTPPLRRVDRSVSGDLRGASKKSDAKSRAKSSSEIEAELDIGIPSSSTYDPVTDKGKSRADMADVYEGWGDVRGQSPMSPTRPPSMRKRQSMQLLDLETRLDQMVSENRLLASQKLTAERALQEQARDHSQERHAYEEAMQEHKIYLTRKDSELSELKQIIEQLHDQAAHLTEVNDGLASSRGVDEEHEQRYSQLRAEHAHTHEQWQQSTRELEDLKEQHSQLSTGMEDIVRHEVTVALEEKNLELRQLQSELEKAKQQVRNLQQQLLVSRNSDDFVERDEDYFDSKCQSLCQHVQQWVLRFSKFSDMKACYLPKEIQDEKIVDRMENAILDGSDVDDYLSDRVKRRDVFMSVVMTMIWEFVFTRYLFGMDREQRQKLKNLEKTLQEVGPISAVHKWRATTLTLLMKREAFENQRATDTEAVVHEIYDTLATFLPPPSHLVGQIQDSLRKVIDMAVDLSIEMRTQRAEFSMLPPLQPEYNTNGDLARKVYFSALTMNERSGATSSNEALQEQHAVVRMVLFPLVVKNEDDDEQIVVCPAQVLTAEGSKGKKTVRVLSAQGGRSEASFAGSDVRMEGGMI